MSVSNTPILCGGTFFTLLLEAGKQGLYERRKWGVSADFTESDVLEALIQIAVPTYKKPADNKNFSSVTSAFKSCNSSKSGRLPIHEQANISSFNDRIANDYQNTLGAMNVFTERFISAEGKGVWLLKALLELIAEDINTDGVEFYITHDGLPTKKAALGGIDEYCLPAFLLGVWCYIVNKVSKNSVGRATYEEWCKPGKSANTRKAFKSNIGESLSSRKIVLIPYTEPGANAEAEDEIFVDNSDESSDAQYAEQGEPHVRIEADNPKYSAEQQVIIEGNLYLQRGEKSKQFFGNVENVYD